ncbi:MAG: hypothetical protein ACREM6_14690 [Vulcanimicrobiaceae bacterium]
MNDGIFDLPPRAQELIRTIEATIAEGEQLASADNAVGDALFSLRESKVNYLPKTIEAYLAIPRSQRAVADEAGHTAEDELLKQLSILDRATKRQLESLAQQRRSDLAVNARFLAERFDDRSTDVSQPTAFSDSGFVAAPGFRNWLPADSGDAQAVVAFVARKFQAALPAATKLTYAGLWGMGRVEAVLITVDQPRGAAFRYTLSAERNILQASVTKLMHGVSIQTVPCQVEAWMQSLYEDLREQAKSQAQMRNALGRLMQ